MTEVVDSEEGRRSWIADEDRLMNSTDLHDDFIT